MKIADLKKDHPMIYKKALEYQKEHGNEPNDQILLDAGKNSGGFNWLKTTEGPYIWNAIDDKKFNYFYENRNKKIESSKNNLKEFGYYIDNLWEVDDIEGDFTDKEKMQIIHLALTNDETKNQIQFAINMAKEVLNLDKANLLWKQLGNIPVNEDDEIDEPFLDFEIGTDKFEIWHWFEEKFNISVAKDLMGEVKTKNL